MEAVFLVIHLIIALALVTVVLIQRSEGGALGIGGGPGGGGGGMGGLFTARGAGNMLTRITAILAAAFMTTSIILAIISSRGGVAPNSALDMLSQPVAPVSAPTDGEEQAAEETQPASTTPTVPLSEE